MTNIESNLSKAAQKVLPELREMYKEMRENFKTQLDDYGMVMEDLKSRAENWENLVELTNKICRGEASDTEKVDFKMIFMKLKSNIELDPALTEEAKTIRANFLRKLENSALG